MSTWPVQEEDLDYARHVRRSAIVDTVEQAFQFAIRGIDEEKFKAPQIAIEPIMTYDSDTGELPQGVIRYEVTVAGHA